jgi:tRNA (guanine-N7-)-methyltransferase
MADARDEAGAFFGRRRGKTLRAGQRDLVATLLPRLRVPAEGPVDLGRLFGRSVADPVLEIGFGGGEHLTARARERPDAGFVGCEPFVNGMAKMLAAVEREGLENVRLWDEDATALLPRLPAGAFATAYLLYPDPWPKRRQRKRRFVSPETLEGLARILRPGGLFRFASDIDDYAGWTLARALAHPSFRWTAERADDWRAPFPGWPGTRYEAKALREGRVPTYLTFERT